ncbi:hypothetical protein D3C72_802850 [compost metagenome]
MVDIFIHRIARLEYIIYRRIIKTHINRLAVWTHDGISLCIFCYGSFLIFVNAQIAKSIERSIRIILLEIGEKCFVF